MDVLSLEALAFLAAVAVLLVTAGSLAKPGARGARLAILCAANLAFLGIAHPAAPLVFLATTIGAWALARAAARGLAAPLFAAAVAALASLLFLPKLGIFGESAAGTALSGFAAAFAKAPAFFVGCSYFTMRALQMVFDARRERAAPPGLLETIAWNGFFPTIVAGPIERSQHFAESLERIGRPTLDDALDGAWRIFLGLLKKVVLSQLAFAWTQPLLDFEHGAIPGRGPAWAALYAFGLYFYFDFSGYSDLAIGAGRLCGIRIAENFDIPFLRPNISEFWRTWHISLSTWIRDYAFVPLCGRSTNPWRPRAASVASMVLCGLWHGPTVGWAVWGAFHGVALSIHQSWVSFLRRRFKLKQRLAKSKLVWCAGTFVTFNFLAFAWTWTAYATAGPATTLRFLRLLIAW